MAQLSTLGILSNMKNPKVLAIIGIICVLFGSWFLVGELIHALPARQYQGIDATTDGSSSVVPTPEFVQWSAANAYCMWIGIGLITLGSIVQIFAVSFTHGTSTSRPSPTQKSESEKPQSSSAIVGKEVPHPTP